MSGKRVRATGYVDSGGDHDDRDRGSASGATRNDTKLTRVARALENLMHPDAGSVLTSGTRHTFPPPGLRLPGDGYDLPLPLRTDELDAIMHKDRNQDTVCELYEIETCNPHWVTFLETLVAAIQEPLGISTAARVDATLKKLVVVSPGGSLPVGTADGKQQRGVFGSLVVVLPGAFTGGEISVAVEGDASEPTTLRWDPGSSDRNVHGISYAAFYHNIDGLRAAPITNGHALCLVYDLVTTTIHVVPRFAGARVLEEAIHESLAQYFEDLPRATKRLKISDDVRRTIHEFSVSRRFVYTVTNDSFEELQDDDKRVADLVAAFCAQSSGQYVLYLAEMSCSRKSYDSDPTEQTSLRSHWIPSGSSTARAH